MPPTAWRGKDHSGINPDATNGSWSFAGPTDLKRPNGYSAYYSESPVAGRATCVAFDPTTNTTWYQGSAGGGLWKTKDSGQTWACLSDSPSWTTEFVSSVAVDPLNGNVIYAGTGDFDGFFPGYDEGVMKSTDGGLTWATVTPDIPGISNLAVSHILVDPDNDQIVTITTGQGQAGGPTAGTGNVWRSTNGGATWGSADLPASDYCALDVSVSDGTKRTYWAAGAGEPALLYESTNQGATWAAVTPPDASLETQWALAASKVYPNTLYVLFTTSQQIYRSDDGGQTWSEIIDNSFTTQGVGWSYATYDYMLGTCAAQGAPYGELLFCGLQTLSVTQDNGVEWFDAGQVGGNAPLLHGGMHGFATSPSSSGEIAVATDGGAYALNCKYEGQDYVPVVTLGNNQVNAQLPTEEIYQVSPHPTNTSDVLAGSLTDGSPLLTSGSSAWISIGDATGVFSLPAGLGDGGWSAWDLPQNVLITTEDGGYVAQCNLSGSLSKVLSKGFPKGGYLQPLVTSNDGSKVIDGDNTLEIYDFSNTSAGFVSQGKDLTGGPGNYLQTVATVQGDNDRLYTGSSDGLIYMTSDLGKTYTELDNSQLPSGIPVGAIQANPDSENMVLAGFQSMGDGISHLWVCDNVTAATASWVDVSGSGTTGLPDAPINGIVFDPYQPYRVWYVATDVGIFETFNAGQTWSNLGGGLPLAQVFDLKYANGYLYAGTFGRGIWRIATAPPAVLTNIALDPSTVIGGGASTGTYTYSNLTTAASINTSFTSGDPSLATVPSVENLAATATSGTITVTTVPVSASTAVTISASAFGVTKSASLTIVPAAVSGLSLSASSAIGGSAVTGTITLNAAAPVGGQSVSLSSSALSAASVPVTVLVPSGATSANVTISTYPVSANSSPTITATIGASSQSQRLNVLAATPTTFALNYTNQYSGGIVLGTVTLNGPGAPTGSVVSLSSSNTSAATLPSSLTVANGNATGQVTIHTFGVATNTRVTLTASIGTASATAVLTIRPAALASVVPQFTTVGEDAIESGTISLNGFAPPAGAKVSISSSNAAVLAVNSSCTVAAQTVSATFTISTSTVSSATTVTIRASYAGLTKTVSVTVEPEPAPLSLTVTYPQILGGESMSGTVTLSQTVASATLVSLSSNTSAASVPASVNVPAGSNAVKFTINTGGVSAIKLVTLTASLNGGVRTAQFSVYPAVLLSLTPTAPNLGPQQSTTCTVKLAGTAPYGGAVVSLSSSNPAALAVPANVTVSNQKSSTSFSIQAQTPAATATVTVSGVYGSVTKTATVTVYASPIPLSVSFSPISFVAGGGTLSGTVTMSGSEPSAANVTLSSSNSAAGSVPASVSVSSGSSSGSFILTSRGVAANTPVTISASANGVTATGNIIVDAGVLQYIATSPTTVTGGSVVAIHLAINAAAPPGGVVVSLSSSNPAILPLPSTAMISEGAKTVVFSIATTAPSVSTQVTLNANFNGVTKTTTLTITP